MKYVVIIAAILAVTFAQLDETSYSTTSFPESENGFPTPIISDSEQEYVEESATKNVVPEPSSDKEDSIPQSENEPVDENTEPNNAADIITVERQEQPTESSENLDFSLESEVESENQLSSQPSSEQEPLIETESETLSPPQESYVGTDSVTEPQLDSEVPQESLSELEPSFSSEPDLESSQELLTEPKSLTLSEPSTEILSESTEEQNSSEPSFEVDQQSISDSESPTSPTNYENSPEALTDSESSESEDQTSESAVSADTETLAPSTENLDEFNEEPLLPENPTLPETELPLQSSEEYDNAIPEIRARVSEITESSGTVKPDDFSSVVPEFRHMDIATAKRTQPSFAQKTPTASKYSTTWPTPTTTRKPFTLQPRPITSTLRPYTPIANHISSADQNAETLYYENEINSNGTYRYAFETSNGIASEAEGSLRTFEGEPPTTDIVASGAFSWIYPNGDRVFVKYTADENGYHPESDVLPTSPPVPPQIARALEWLRRVNEEKELKQSRQ